MLLVGRHEEYSVSKNTAPAIAKGPWRSIGDHWLTQRNLERTRKWLCVRVILFLKWLLLSSCRHCRLINIIIIVDVLLKSYSLPHSLLFLTSFHVCVECPRREIYFLSVIDILTRYGVKKRTANAVKTVKYGAGAEISTIEPEQYARRFLSFIESVFK